MDKTPLDALVATLADAARPIAAAVKRPMVVYRRVLQALQASTPAPAAPQQFEYKFPELPPGVLPTTVGALAMDAALPGEVKRTSIAMDGGAGGCAPTTWGGFGNGFGSGLWFPGYPYLAELTQITEYRAPCETISTEMTRKWFELQSKGTGDKSDKIAEIMARMEELKVRELFRRASLLDCEFGRAQIYMNIDDADERRRQLPLNLEAGINVGSLKSLQCIEPYWSTPYSWNAMYPEREDFYKPTSWYVMGRKTHATRLLTFIGHEVPDLLKPAYNFSGISLSQLGQPSVNMWLRTRKAVNDLINNFSIPVLATDMAATLEEGGEPGSGLLARLQTFTLTRNNQMVAAINKDSEELSFAEASLASLDKLQAQSQEHMAASWRVPLVKLLGITPAGLGATSEGEIQVWYDLINAMQEQFYGPHLRILLRVVQMDLYGEVDDDIVVHWITLDEPTQKELSEIRKSDADAGTAYINAGVVSPEEERGRLQDDPDSGYTNLTGPPPEPEIDPTMAASMENDNEQAGIQREHESGKAVLAAAAKPEPAAPIKAKTGK